MAKNRKSLTMNITLALKRPFIWFSRLRRRCGYGVHSPFAFDLIRYLIYEKMPYYAYEQLALEQKRLAKVRGRGWNRESKNVNRLLFRLVNKSRPHTIVDVGTLSASALYLQAGRTGANYISASDLSALFLETGVPVDFLYLHHYKNPLFVEEAFGVCVARSTEESVFVIEGIHYSKPMKKLWKRMQTDEKVGVTFDLYDLGILFFDKTKIKQHYIVNF